MLQRSVGVLVVVLALFAAPRQARAEFTLAGSAGFGFQVNPTTRVGGVNLMVTPGYQFFEVLRLELGILGAVENAVEQSTELGVEFRPMLTFDPPSVPLFGRVIFASVDPFSDARRAWAWGLALGVDFNVGGGTEVFAELEALPRYFNGAMRWLLEARAGVLFRF